MGSEIIAEGKGRAKTVLSAKPSILGVIADKCKPADEEGGGSFT